MEALTISICEALEVTPKEIEIYVTSSGRLPFSDWLNSLKDLNGAAKILLRLDRVRLGSLGDYKILDYGVCELRIPAGPGYRVYFGQAGHRVIVLLCGGDKSTQKQDILTAIHYWADYRSRADA